MTTPIAEALRIVAARLHPSADAVQLRRLAGMVERLEERTMEEGAAYPSAVRDGVVVPFRGR